METFLADIADIHGRAFAHSLKPLKHLNIGGTIIGFVLCSLFHFVH